MVLFSAPLHLFAQALRQRSAALGWISSCSPSHASLKKTLRVRACVRMLEFQGSGRCDFALLEYHPTPAQKDKFILSEL